MVYNAIQKYGWDNIEHKVLADNLTKEKAEQYEISLIKQYNTINIDYGYNIASGGYVNILSEESKRKLSLSKIGRKMNDDFKQKVKENNADFSRGNHPQAKKSYMYKHKRSF